MVQAFKSVFINTFSESVLTNFKRIFASLVKQKCLCFDPTNCHSYYLSANSK